MGLRILEARRIEWRVDPAVARPRVLRAVAAVATRGRNYQTDDPATHHFTSQKPLRQTPEAHGVLVSHVAQLEVSTRLSYLHTQLSDGE